MATASASHVRLLCAFVLALLAGCLAAAHAAPACAPGDLKCACTELGGVPTINRRNFNATCRLFLPGTATRGE